MKMCLSRQSFAFLKKTSKKKSSSSSSKNVNFNFFFGPLALPSSFAAAPAPLSISLFSLFPSNFTHNNITVNCTNYCFHCIHYFHTHLNNNALYSHIHTNSNLKSNNNNNYSDKTSYDNSENNNDCDSTSRYLNQKLKGNKADLDFEEAEKESVGFISRESVNEDEYIEFTQNNVKVSPNEGSKNVKQEMNDMISRKETYEQQVTKGEPDELFEVKAEEDEMCNAIEFTSLEKNNSNCMNNYENVLSSKYTTDYETSMRSMNMTGAYQNCNEENEKTNAISKNTSNTENVCNNKDSNCNSDKSNYRFNQLYESFNVSQSNEQYKQTVSKINSNFCELDRKVLSSNVYNSYNNMHCNSNDANTYNDPTSIQNAVYKPILDLSYYYCLEEELNSINIHEESCLAKLMTFLDKINQISISNAIPIDLNAKIFDKLCLYQANYNNIDKRDRSLLCFTFNTINELNKCDGNHLSLFMFFMWMICALQMRFPLNHCESILINILDKKCKSNPNGKLLKEDMEAAITGLNYLGRGMMGSPQLLSILRKHHDLLDFISPNSLCCYACELVRQGAEEGCNIFSEIQEKLIKHVNEFGILQIIQIIHSIHKAYNVQNRLHVNLSNRVIERLLGWKEALSQLTLYDKLTLLQVLNLHRMSKFQIDKSAATLRSALCGELQKNCKEKTFSLKDCAQIFQMLRSFPTAHGGPLVGAGGGMVGSVYEDVDESVISLIKCLAEQISKHDLSSLGIVDICAILDCIWLANLRNVLLLQNIAAFLSNREEELTISLSRIGVSLRVWRSILRAYASLEFWDFRLMILCKKFITTRDSLKFVDGSYITSFALFIYKLDLHDNECWEVISKRAMQILKEKKKKEVEEKMSSAKALKKENENTDNYNEGYNISEKNSCDSNLDGLSINSSNTFASANFTFDSSSLSFNANELRLMASVVWSLVHCCYINKNEFLQLVYEKLLEAVTNNTMAVLLKDKSCRRYFEQIIWCFTASQFYIIYPKNFHLLVSHFIMFADIDGTQAFKKLYQVTDSFYNEGIKLLEDKSCLDQKVIDRMKYILHHPQNLKIISRGYESNTFKKRFLDQAAKILKKEGIFFQTLVPCEPYMIDLVLENEKQEKIAILFCERKKLLRSINGECVFPSAPFNEHIKALRRVGWNVSFIKETEWNWRNFNDMRDVLLKLFEKLEMNEKDKNLALSSSAEIVSDEKNEDS